MINDGVLITANNWPSAWQPRGNKEAATRRLNTAPKNVKQSNETPELIKKSH